MKLYAHLLLVAFALTARAATIPELPEKINNESPAEPPKEPIDNVSIEKELSDETNVVKNEEDNLSLKTIEDIPVKVIVEDVPLLKRVEEGNEVSAEQLKKIREEIKDPGTPQRQEHETQNPEHHIDSITLKQSVEEVSYPLKRELQELREKFNEYLVSNENINSIKTSIESLQNRFNDQIQTLKAVFTNNVNTQSVEVQENIPEDQIKANIQTLETNFNDGINNLKKSVEAISLLKADSSDTNGSPSTDSETSTASSNPIMEAITNFQTTMANNWQNFVQNFNNQSPPANAQSDAEGTTTSRPFQNIFAGFFGQGQNSGSNSGPFAALINVFNPQSTSEKPAESGQESKPSESEPETKPEGEKNTGPIRQILERNPIIKGITGAVQRLQQNINNPEKPRDTVKKPQAEPEKVEPAKVEAVNAEAEKPASEKTEKEKGLIYGPGHGGNHGGSGMFYLYY